MTRRLVVGVIATAVLVSGCTAGSSGQGGGGGGGGGDTANDTLLVNTSFVYSTLDPGRVYEQTGYVAIHGMYDAMMTFKGSDVTTPVPNLAEGFKASDDKKTYTFTLRTNAVFADGSPVTAQDAVFSLTRLQNLKSSAANFFVGLTFAAPDDKTLVVTSPTPNSTIPTLMAMPASSVINSKLATQNGATAAADAAGTDTARAFLDSKSAGSGPYVLDRNDPGNEIVLVVNAKYWGAKPAFERVVIRNSDAQNQKLSISRASSAEVAVDITGALLEGLPATLNVSSAKDTVYMLYGNTDPAVSPITANKDFFPALRASLDYEGLAAQFSQGGGRIGGYVADAYLGAIPADKGPVQDLQKASRLVQAARLGDAPVRFIYPAITYRGVDLGTIATKVQGDAAKSGLKLELTPLALPAFLEEQRSGNMVLGFTPQALVYPRPEAMVNILSPPGGSNAARVRWKDTEGAKRVAGLADAVRAATSDDQLKEAMVKWQEAMAEVSPFLPVGQNSGAVVSTPNVTGVVYTPGAGWQFDVAAAKPA